MSVFYFDSSALAKRYLDEIGSTWVDNLTDPASGHRILVAEITLVEVAAALAARHRAPSGLSRLARDHAVTLLQRHFAIEYEANATDRRTLTVAMALTQRHRLRGYDAVQLATALTAGDALRAARLPDLTFITADADLIEAARAEGLNTDDPNLHP